MIVRGIAGEAVTIAACKRERGQEQGRGGG
jgi:hypothetical protein